MFWPDHPQVSIENALTEIGRAAANGKAPDPATLERVRGVLRKAPLSAEPFLVEGTRALSAGDREKADVLLSEAALRDPRLPATRFLLADLYLQQGRTNEGLKQIAALIRRLPKAAGPLTPSLVEFAKQPGAAPQVRTILDHNPQLRGNVLSALADNAANAALVLELAGKEPRANPIPDWQVRLIAGLVKRGDYAKAYRLWSHFAGVAAGPEPRLFNPRFEDMRPPPPFNWLLANGSAGVAEPAAGGGLHVLYYGREQTVLAAQILMLKPGRYRLRHSGGGEGSGLAWSVNCLPAKSVLAGQPVDSQDLVFTVPSSHCAAQELQLRGSPSETATTVDVTIRNLGLAPESRQ